MNGWDVRSGDESRRSSPWQCRRPRSTPPSCRAARRGMAGPLLRDGLGRTAQSRSGCMPHNEWDEAQREQAIQEVVACAGLEVWPDLGPLLAHEPPSDGDIEGGHEARQGCAQEQVRAGRLKVDAGNEQPADDKGKERPRQRAELDCSFLAEARDDERGSGNAVKRLGCGQDDAKGGDAQQSVRVHADSCPCGLTHELGRCAKAGC